MPTRFWCFTFLILIFVGLYSCKKENNNSNQHTQNNHVDNCTTVPDCQIIGTYSVMVYYNSFITDVNNGSASCEIDSSRGPANISLTETGPDTLLFTDSSIAHIQFKIIYDTTLNYYRGSGTLPIEFCNGGIAFGCVAQAYIQTYSGDSINIVLYDYCGSMTFPARVNYNWSGIKLH